jgi:hypothetical protein
MNTIGRRRFLAYLGAGVVAIAGGTVLIVRRQLSGNGQGKMLNFQAITRLPGGPLPSYASYVIGGQVNLNANTGSITKNVFAGPPETITNIALLTRAVRVTSVQQQGSLWHIAGVVNTQTQLQAGEETTFAILLDPAHNLAQSTFFGSPIQLTLQKFSAPS